MKILLTGATGYIGKRLLPLLIQSGHTVVCCARDVNRFNPPKSFLDKIEVIQVDLLKPETLANIPQDIDAAYYLVHSMAVSSDYHTLEEESAINFRKAIEKTNAAHVVYLGGIINENELSKHLDSRKNVEVELKKGSYNFTSLRAGIIIGSGSASFEIIRDLVEKLPFMITPKWLMTKCQPIGIKDVILLLSKTLLNSKTYNQNFDIGGPDILTYKEMLLQFAKARNLKRKIVTVPIMTPRLSSYWLFFVTSTSYKLAVSLVNSMKVEVVCRDTRINDLLEVQPRSYADSLDLAFQKIKDNSIISSWKDAYASSDFNIEDTELLEVPTFGCFIDKRQAKVVNHDSTLGKIWRIGGKNGWYYGNWLWRFRGYIDKLFGGVGLRRGRTNLNEINAGDSLDFWRVLYANKEEGRLLLFAEMKLPGEAWLEFKIVEGELIQTATFRPLGIMGRLYWYSVLPFHGFIFKGMIRRINDPSV